MPTASKLFAAFGFALVAFFTAEIFKPHMPEGTQFGAFTFVSAVIGLLCGWRYLGPDVGRGWWEAANAGLRTALAALAVALLVFSTEGMLVFAFRRAYDTPIDAIVGVVAVGVDLIQRVIAPDVLAALFGGGMMAGLLSEWAARRWS
jgi:hypothetical protein